MEIPLTTVSIVIDLRIAMKEAAKNMLEHNTWIN